LFRCFGANPEYGPHSQALRNNPGSSAYSTIFTGSVFTGNFAFGVVTESLPLQMAGIGHE